MAFIPELATLTMRERPMEEAYPYLSDMCTSTDVEKHCPSLTGESDDACNDFDLGRVFVCEIPGVTTPLYFYREFRWTDVLLKPELEPEVLGHILNKQSSRFAVENNLGEAVPLYWSMVDKDQMVFANTPRASESLKVQTAMLANDGVGLDPAKTHVIGYILPSNGGGG